MTVDRLSDELRDILGEEGFLKLVESVGGERLYVPTTAAASKLAGQVGPDIAARLSNAYPGSYLRIPLARDFRARQYRAGNATNKEIARRLGMTETGVQKLLSREPTRLTRVDPRQIDLFTDR